MTATCVVCTRPMPDTAFACPVCAGKAKAQLRDLIDMTPAARDVAHGQARRGSGGGGGSEPRLPFNLGATQRLDAVQHELTGLARMVAEERQGATWVWTGDAITEAAMWLTSQTEWLRHHQAADEHFAVIASCARVVEGVARGPSSQRYLGPCGAEREHGDLCQGTVCFEDDFTAACACWCHKGEAAPCPGDIYAREGAQSGVCRLCRATVGVDDRRAWLDDLVRSEAFRASEIAHSHGISADTIRSWAFRGKLKSYWRTDTGIVVAWTDPPEGETRERLHYLGDVLDLAAADAARRAGDQAKRARRKDNAA